LGIVVGVLGLLLVGVGALMGRMLDPALESIDFSIIMTHPLPYFCYTYSETTLAFLKKTSPSTDYTINAEMFSSHPYSYLKLYPLPYYNSYHVFYSYSIA
jgi:hypothetical protein